MGIIRNKMVIVHHYDKEMIQKIREDAVRYFQELVRESTIDLEYDVDTQMISPILSSIVNGELSFVIMGDCSKLGWRTSEIFRIGREKWIDKWQKEEESYLLLLVEFGEEYESKITQYE